MNDVIGHVVRSSMCCGKKVDVKRGNRIEGIFKNRPLFIPASSKDQKQEIASIIIEFGNSCGKEGE